MPNLLRLPIGLSHGQEPVVDAITFSAKLEPQKKEDHDSSHFLERAQFPGFGAQKNKNSSITQEFKN